MRVVRGAPNVILWKNRRLKSQNVTSGPSLLRCFQSREFCAVNGSSCAVMYVRGAIRKELSGGVQNVTLEQIGEINHETCPSGPSLPKLGHCRKCCAVNDSSCAVIYVWGAIV